MTGETSTVAAARVRAESARARLMDTARELQARLSPKTLAHNAWEGAKMKGADLAEDAVDAVKARPMIATGVVAALAMFLARDPLKSLAGQVADGVSTKRKTRSARKAASRPTNKTEKVQ